jgi:hypothetical protein
VSNQRIAKIVISAIVALDLVALVAVSVHRTSTTTTTTRRPASLAIAPPAVTSSPTPSATPTPTLGPPSVSPIAPPVVVSVPTTSAPSTTTSTPTSPPSGGSSTPPVVTAVANCPIPLAKPAVNGGLQSLIDFAPAFGPFSAEAFAMASAYQPVLQLLGPILAQFPALETKFQPQITALLTPFQNVLNSVFSIVAPLYSPYREQVLTAETTFAAFLAPYAESLANSPLGGCVVDVEAALVGDVAKSDTSNSSTSVTGRLTNP